MNPAIWSLNMEYGNYLKKKKKASKFLKSGFMLQYWMDFFFFGNAWKFNVKVNTSTSISSMTVNKLSKKYEDLWNFVKPKSSQNEPETWSLSVKSENDQTDWRQLWSKITQWLNDKYCTPQTAYCWDWNDLQGLVKISSKILFCLTVLC